MEKIDLTSTLEVIEDDFWGRAPFFASGLVKRCHQLRKKRLKDFEAGDFRCLIGQKFSLEILFPLAVDLLEQNPLIEGDFYPGDLLENCLKAHDGNDASTSRLISVCHTASEELEKVDFVAETLTEQISLFLEKET